MGSLFSTLNIAVSGLQAAQVQLNVTGHNIANVNTPGFSRQRAELVTRVPLALPFGVLGRGVKIASVARLRDTFLDIAFRRHVPGLGRAEVQARFLAQIEDIFLEPSDVGFSNRINAFFDALNDFASNVESLSVRQSLISETQAVAASLNEVVSRLDQLRTDANEEVRNMLPEINSIAERVAALNDLIPVSEASGHTANDLRDERDLLLDELARLVNITVSERDDGQVVVLIGSDELVSGTLAMELEAVPNPALDPERIDLLEVRFVGTTNLVDIQDGELFGALTMRDTILVDVDTRIDQIAATIIEEINKIHTQSNGLQNLSGAVTGSNRVTDSAVALSAAGLPFAVTPGTFDVVVYDAAGVPTTTTITITAATTLDNLAAALDAVANLSATVTPDGALQVTPTAPFTFAFANDTSGVLTALGVNGLFTGFDARTIGVNQDLVDDPALISSGFSLDVLDTGDNSAALAMADVRNGRFLDSGLSTVNDFFESTIAQIGVEARRNQDTLRVDQAFVDDFQRRRQEVSGVSLDEETVGLLQFQRAFEASARVITIVDRMLEVLLSAAL